MTDCMDNYIRLVIFAVEGCPKPLVELFLKKAKADIRPSVPYSNIDSYVQYLQPTIKTMLIQKVIHGDPPVDIRKWDTSLVTTMLQNIFKPLTPHEQKLIVDIRNARTELFHEARTSPLDYRDFKSKWNQLETAVTCMALCVSSDCYSEMTRYITDLETKSLHLEGPVIDNLKQSYIDDKEFIINTRLAVAATNITMDIINDDIVRRTKTSSTVMTKIKTNDPVLESMKDNFKLTTKQLRKEDFQPSDEMEDVKSKFRRYHRVVITGKSSLEFALTVINDRDIRHDRCVQVTEADEIRHVRSDDVDLVLCINPFGKEIYDENKAIEMGKHFDKMLENTNLPKTDGRIDVMIVSETAPFIEYCSHNEHDLLDQVVTLNKPTPKAEPIQNSVSGVVVAVIVIVIAVAVYCLRTLVSGVVVVVIVIVIAVAVYCLRTLARVETPSTKTNAVELTVPSSGTGIIQMQVINNSKARVETPSTKTNAVELIVPSSGTGTIQMQVINNSKAKPFQSDSSQNSKLKKGDLSNISSRVNLLKKETDDTLGQAEVNTLAETMKSVGSLININGLMGTVFRVGSKYLMTNWHVVKAKVDPTDTETFDCSRLENECVYVNFNANTTQRQSRDVRVSRDIVFKDENLDVAVLEIRDPSPDIPKPLLLCITEQKNIKEVSLVGFGHPYKETKKILDQKCYIIPSGSALFTEAISYVNSNRDMYKDALPDNDKHLINEQSGFTDIYDDNRFCFSCFIENGGSGSPALMTNDTGSCIVVGMLTSGTPEFLFALNKSSQERLQFPNKYRFETAMRMSAIYESMVKNGSVSLTQNIFQA